MTKRQDGRVGKWTHVYQLIATMLLAQWKESLEPPASQIVSGVLRLHNVSPNFFNK